MFLSVFHVAVDLALFSGPAELIVYWVLLQDCTPFPFGSVNGSLLFLFWYFDSAHGLGAVEEQTRTFVPRSTGSGRAFYVPAAAAATTTASTPSAAVGMSAGRLTTTTTKPTDTARAAAVGMGTRTSSLAGSGASAPAATAAAAALSAVGGGEGSDPTIGMSDAQKYAWKKQQALQRAQAVRAQRVAEAKVRQAQAQDGENDENYF